MFTVDSTTFYWGDLMGDLRSVPLAGGTPKTLAAGISPEGIAVDTSNVYIASDLEAVSVVPLGGGAPKVLAIDMAPESVVVTSTAVFWAAGPGGQAVRFVAK